MSKANPSRRAILATLPAVAVLAAPAGGALHPDTFPFTHDCDLDLLELRRAIDAYQAAVRYEMSIEGEPGHAAAEAESDRCQAVCEALADAIHDRTPAALRDITLRAEVLRMYFFGGPVDMLAELGCDRQNMALAKLYDAAVIVGGLNANDAS